MSETQESTKGRDITRLLLKAVKGLPEEEQQIVFDYYFEQGVADLQSLPRTIHRAFREPTETVFGPQKTMGPDQVTIPVRLSEKQHQKLKRWAAMHNFPMAVVVRGLIERFLDDWEERILRSTR